MKQEGIRSKVTKKFVVTTDFRHSRPVVANKLDRDLKLTDRTVLATACRSPIFLYLHAVDGVDVGAVSPTQKHAVARDVQNTIE